MNGRNTDYEVRDSGLLVRPEALNQPEADSAPPENIQQVTVSRDLSPVAAAAPVSGNPGPVVRGDKPASVRVRLARRRARVRGQLGEVPDFKVDAAGERMDRAVQLEALAADPRAEAWTNRRVRTWMLRALAAVAGGGALLSAIFSALSVTEALHLVGRAWFVAAMGPDVLMGGLMALSLVMRAVLSQRGLTIAPESDAAYRTAEKTLGFLIAAITIGPSLGAAAAAGIAWAHGALPTAFGWAVVAVAVHAIGPVVVWTSAALAPHITGDLARISQHTARRIAEMALTSINPGSAQATGPTLATSGNPVLSQFTDRNAATSGIVDPVITRARRELGAGVSGKQIARWYRASIGPIGQERVGEIRDALRSGEDEHAIPA